MNRQYLIEGLLQEGFRKETLSVLNDKQLQTLYRKMVSETNIVIHDPQKVKDVKQQIDPEKDSIEVRETEQEMEEGLLKKRKKSSSKIVGGGQPPMNTPDAQKRGLEVEKKLKDAEGKKETKEGWESKIVAKTHKKVNSAHGRLKAAQTKMDDKWIKVNREEKEQKRIVDRKKRKEEREKKKEVKESNIGKFHKPVFKNEEELAEKVGCNCGKCDICNKDKSKKKPTGLSEENFLSLAKKGDIMQMIQEKLVENAPTTAPTKPKTAPGQPTTKPTIKPKTPFRPAPGPNTAPKAELKNMLPDFLRYNSIFGKRFGNGPAIAPSKPKTAPGQPTTKPGERQKPKTPFRPAPGPNTAPKAEKVNPKPNE